MNYVEKIHWENWDCGRFKRLRCQRKWSYLDEELLWYFWMLNAFVRIMHVFGWRWRLRSHRRTALKAYSFALQNVKSVTLRWANFHHHKRWNWKSSFYTERLNASLRFETFWGYITLSLLKRTALGYVQRHVSDTLRLSSGRQGGPLVRYVHVSHVIHVIYVMSETKKVPLWLWCATSHLHGT